MSDFQPLLLEVWREACRHVEIADAVAEAAPTLFADLPVDLLIVRRLEVDRSALETVAIGVCHPCTAPKPTRSELRPAALARVLEWCRRDQVLGGSAAEIDLFADLLPPGLSGQVLAGPLNSGDIPVGVAIFIAFAPHRLDESHESMMRLLLEPFTFWLENDHRLRELNALREAAEAENRSLLARLGKYDISDSIIGAETGLKPVMERVELVARTDVPVLILGETGSGKEVVSRTIHQRSRRATGPFLRVNCGAIPSELVDSELFGHERGSFTGAIGDRKGWFERADGGTLFLDECGELPPAAQVRLLRILQDGSFERVGGERTLHVDVRVIAATHRDLQTMVTQGQFREDLWYRLAVFPLRLPPLRDRIEDIPVMAVHFAARAAQRTGVPQVAPSLDDIQLLAAYSWPGNVRELAAVIERAVILGEGKRLDVATALGVAPANGRMATSAGAATVVLTPDSHRKSHGTAADRDKNSPFATLDAAMAQHISAALERTKGRIEGARGAAALLGINPHTLRARMRKLQVDWANFRPE